MAGYTKLFSSIVHSTIWREPNHVRIVWVTMLALSDARGEVMASAPGLADIARVSIEECRQALEVFQSPDPDSGNPDHEGRRVERIQGGWRLINHRHYRDLMSADERRARDAERKRLERASKERPRTSEIVRDVSHSDPAPDPDPTPERDPERAGKPGSRFAPAEFEPNESHRVRCQELRLDIAEELRAFRLHEFNRAYSDWPRRFGKWIEETKVKRETERAKGMPEQRAPQPTPAPRVPGMPPWVHPDHAALARRLSVPLRATAKEFASTYHLPVDGLRPSDLKRPLEEFIKRKAEHV